MAVVVVLLAFVTTIMSAQSVGQTGIDPMEIFGLIVLLAVAAFSNASQVQLFYVAGVVAVACGLAGDVMSDFKTGAIIGTSPRAMWVGQAIGALLGTVVAVAVLVTLFSAYGPGAFGSGQMFVSAQASVVATMVSGIPSVPGFVIGLLGGIVLYWAGLPAMMFGLGVYLPFYMSLTAALGAGVRWVYERVCAARGVEYFDKVIAIDQSPIGRTPRSNPATYTGVFTAIRDLFAATPDAKAMGFKSGRFSFNVAGGRCENCQGDGIMKIEMHFLPDVYVPCEVCGGKRYNRETLEVRYKGKTIADVLDMTVEEACDFFKSLPSIYNKLSTLNEVGLGYIRLGQSATTLSGGEAQRVKLATELSKRSTGRTFYILDEPTTGLHSYDVDKLIKILLRLRDSGNTVLVIEHNLDVIKVADYIVDLGPEGGDGGGTIVCTGSPEEVAACERSYTGQFLRKMLS